MEELNNTLLIFDLLIYKTLYPQIVNIPLKHMQIFTKLIIYSVTKEVSINFREFTSCQSRSLTTVQQAQMYLTRAQEEGLECMGASPQIME